MALGSTTDVRRITGITSEELTDSEISSYLNEADRIIQGELGKDYMIDRFFVYSISETGTLQRTYNLYFKIKPGSVPTVYKNGLELTVTTDYTIDETKSQLILDSDLDIAEGDLIAILYQPEILDDYANYLASYNILTTKMVNLSSNSLGIPILENIQKLIDNIKNQLKKKPYVLGWVDHYEDGGIW